ncbi:SDR family oxidoreductase [Georgfuchsia toluolica]|nr:SDR family oxidoreductase [Georgfuchsia toluolica]
MTRETRQRHLECEAWVDKPSPCDAYGDPEFVKAITAFTPMSRVADAREIKGTVLYLASAASSYTTRLLLVTDGGRMAK